MKQLTVMLKPASSLCNLRCSYCFYDDISSLREVSSFGIMTESVARSVLDHILTELEAGDRLTLSFQGGEPTLAGLDFYRNLTEYIKQKKTEVQIFYTIQTNGLLLNEEWCEFLTENHVLIGISCDILSQAHDHARTDEKKNGTYRRVVETIRRLTRYRVEYNVLCTLTRQIARHPKQVWNEIKKLGIEYVQFTPCLRDLTCSKTEAFALMPERFASFYQELFDLWYKELCDGQYRSVKLFDDLVQLLSRGLVTACGIGGYCQPQIVVEADGTVYPCDFYCLDPFAVGNLTRDSLRTVYERSAVSACKKREKLPVLCGDCRYRKLCGGGCRRMQEEVCCSFEDTYCGYRDFLNHIWERLVKISRR